MIFPGRNPSYNFYQQNLKSYRILICTLTQIFIVYLSFLMWNSSDPKHKYSSYAFIMKSCFVCVSNKETDKNENVAIIYHK